MSDILDQIRSHLGEDNSGYSASYDASFYNKLNKLTYNPQSDYLESNPGWNSVPISNNTGKLINPVTMGNTRGSVSAATVSSQDQSLSSLDRALAKEHRDWQEVQNQKAMDFEAEQAFINREFQQLSAQKAMDFEATQAQTNRDFQKMMSDTAYQRAVKDLKAAGLNPILAVHQGGSSTPSGSSASGFSSSGSTASGFTSSGSRSDATSVYNAISNRKNASTNENKYKLDKEYAQVYATSNILNSASSLLRALLPW